MTVRDDVWNRELSEPLPSEPQTSYLPVPWTASVAGGASPVLLGGVGDVVPADDHAAAVDEPKPDALTQGWVRPPGGERTEALFVLAGSSMGIGRTERVTSPVWLDLNQLVHLDAIGDPVDGLVEIEITMDDDSVIGAGWSEEFCDAVVLTLTVLADRRAGTAPQPDAGEPAAGPAAAESTPAESTPAEPTPAESAVAPSTVDEPSADRPGPDVTFEDVSPDPATSAASEESSSSFSVSPPPAVSSTPPAPSDDSAPSDETAGVPLGRSATLELEDVVYLGGYPGQSKRRKKCTATMSRTGLELSGPGDLSFRISWESVKTVEVQNSDEARFRMNTKIHRDASALVVECDQGVTILLEARDCPTIALRSAIGQLMTDLPVVVV